MARLFHREGQFVGGDAQARSDPGERIFELIGGGDTIAPLGEGTNTGKDLPGFVRPLLVQPVNRREDIDRGIGIQVRRSELLLEVAQPFKVGERPLDQSSRKEHQTVELLIG